MSNLISRQAALDAIFSEPLYESGMKERDADAVVPAIYEKIKALPAIQVEPLTDYEQRIFLAAMVKEKAVCKKLTDEWDGMKLDVPCPVNLLQLCAEIERKVKAALWMN